MRDEPNKLEYAAPANDPPNVDGLLQAARWLAIVGIAIPLTALGAVVWGIFVLCQPFITEHDRQRASALLVTGVMIAIANLMLIWALVGRLFDALD